MEITCDVLKKKFFFWLGFLPKNPPLHPYIWKEGGNPQLPQAQPTRTSGDEVTLLCWKLSTAFPAWQE